MSTATPTRDEAPPQTGRPGGREILRQQETQEHADRREAVRALLMRPLLTPTTAEAREALRLVRRHSTYLREANAPGWMSLQLERRCRPEGYLISPYSRAPDSCISFSSG
jgi:hypothetical protein